MLKHGKAPKYYDHDCLTIFLLLSTLSTIIQFPGKSAHLAQKSNLYIKAASKQK